MLLVVLAGAAGCGNDDTKDGSGADNDRPSVASLAKALEAGTASDSTAGYTSEEATCVAVVLRDSDLSDESLREIESDLVGFAPSADQEAVYRTVIPQLATCLSGRLTTPTP